MAPGVGRWVRPDNRIQVLQLYEKPTCTCIWCPGNAKHPRLTRDYTSNSCKGASVRLLVQRLVCSRLLDGFSAESVIRCEVRSCDRAEPLSAVVDSRDSLVAAVAEPPTQERRRRIPPPKVCKVSPYWLCPRSWAEKRLAFSPGTSG